MIYHDIDVYGTDNIKGEAKEYFGIDAIKNALFLWISSKKGDYLMSPGEGGPLDINQFKTMTPDNLQNLKFQLLNALTTEFAPSIEVQDIEFIPDYENRLLEIDIVYSITGEGVIDRVSLFVNNDYENINFTYTSVDFTGDNLFEFFTLKKPDQKDNRLIYDYDIDSWKWGKYKLINLTPLDPRFQDILIIANAS